MTTPRINLYLLVALVAVNVGSCAWRYAEAQAEPEEQLVEAAAEGAKLEPAVWNCIWVDERTCVSEAEWERLMRGEVGR